MVNNLNELRLIQSLVKLTVIAKHLAFLVYKAFESEYRKESFASLLCFSQLNTM